MRKKSYEEVKAYIESFGYELLSTEYINNSTKLDMICPKGHKFKMAYTNFQQGQRCPICANESNSDKQRLSYDEVKNYIESFGYKLLSKEYIRAKEKLKMECPNGHKLEMSYDNFHSSGNRCKECRKKELNERFKLSYEEVRKYIEFFGYELLSEEYINNTEKLLVKCPCGYEFLVTFACFRGSKNRNGTRCPKCYGNIKHTYEEVKEYISIFGYELLSEEYINNSEKILVRCPNNHEYEVTYANFYKGRRCPYCQISKGEQKVMDWLNKNNILYIYDEPYFEDLLSPLGNSLRPDFILPDYKIWIEYDGEFHYNKYYEEQKFETLQIHDKLKDNYAKENDWRLIRIPYWDFDRIEEILNKEIKKGD